MMQEQRIWINGERITPATLPIWRKDKCGIEADLAGFLDEWWGEDECILLQTSGSTGKPTTMRARKEHMLASAHSTCRFFGLNDRSQALLCLPLRYIAGKMMVVRALACGMNLLVREPSSSPLKDIQVQLNFVAMVPMQATCTLREPHGAQQLARCGTILLGGGFVDSALEEELQHISAQVYASYGMTETLSHIAMRRVNGADKSDAYTPLPGVSVSLTERGTLAITAPNIGVKNLETNDLATITEDGRFRILGRADSVINSGGIKIQAEEIEQHIAATTGIQCVALPTPHPVLGQAIALLWEGNPNDEPALRQALQELPKYHFPHIIQHIHSLPRTATGKIARRLCAEIINQP